MPKRVIIYGKAKAIQDELDEISKTTILQEVPELTREQTIARFTELQSKHTYDALIFCSGGHAIGRLDATLLSPLLPTLRLICGGGAGFDHVDIDWCTENGITYGNTPIAVSDPTATTATMLILQAVRGSSQAEITLRKGEWRKGLEPTPDVRGLVVGILGLGTIGKLVQRKVEALGFHVIYNNRHRLPPEEEGKARYASFDELIATSDVISVHTPLSDQTWHLLSEAEFEKMKDGVFIVNTARGKVIDEKALVRAMKSRKVLRVGLDVFENEPIVDPYLMETDRASLLPHWAAATTTINADIEKEMLENLKQWLVTGKPNTPVNEPKTK